MFTLSKISPELIFDSGAHLSLGSKLKEFGSRILLICSTNNKDRESISVLKSQLKQFDLIYIQSNSPDGFLNKDELVKIQIRAEDFNVTSVISMGDISHRMAGRFISQRLSLNYIEIPTVFNNSYLLIPQSIYSNRIGNNFENIHISTEIISEIIIDSTLHRNYDKVDIILELLSMLLDLSQLFINKENNIISSNESRNLFNRILNDLEEDREEITQFYEYGITSALYHGASSDIELNLSIYSWITGYRYNMNSDLISSKLLPWYLETSGEHELATRIREILEKNSITGRLTNLGLTLDQLKSVLDNQQSITTIVEKAF